MLKTELDIKVSEATVKRARKKLGWIKNGPKYCQLVKEKNRIARLAFCEEAIRTKDDFADVIFTDECTVCMETHAKICFRRIGAPEAETQSETSLQDSRLGRDKYSWCQRHPAFHRNYEERILCRENSVWSAFAIHQGMFSRWKV